MNIEKIKEELIYYYNLRDYSMEGIRKYTFIFEQDFSYLNEDAYFFINQKLSLGFFYVVHSYIGVVLEKDFYE